MKNFYLLFTIAFCFSAVKAQTVFTYGNNAVGKDEFLRAYNKNNSPVTDKEKSLRDYLELYSNFKLKVKAAEELRLDTLPQIQYDITNFRRQVEENYMSDEKGTALLMDEAFERSQKDLHVLHFSIPVDNAATASDTLAAAQQIMDAYTALAGGNTDYQSVSEKNKLKYSDIGFITVFSVPYEYENIIYGLRPGQVSKPYRSKKAWHVFKLLEERKSIGKWKVAQILISYPPGPTEEQKKNALQKADSIYGLLQGGADFGNLAKTFSDDKLTYMKAGELPEFGTGKYDVEFENEVFRLKADNDITKPFSTSYGVHIVKRIAHAETPAQKDNSGLQFDLKQKLMQDARMNTAKESFAKSVLSLIGYKRSPLVKDNDLYRYADSIMKKNDDTDPAQFPIGNKTIFTFKSGAQKGADWLKFVRGYKSNSDMYKGESNAEIWDKFVTISSMDYYKKHLEEYNDDFKYQMKEFKEGNMLFEIMERNVWSKASADSVGLLKQYNLEKSKYKWAASADVLIFNCTTENLAKETMDALGKGKYWKQIAEESNAAIQADSGRYELSQVTDPSSATNAVANSFSPIIKNSDGTSTFVKYITVYPADQQRSFDEARGLVINDYQNVLEKQWLDTLRKKYPVKINEAVVKQLLK